MRPSTLFVPLLSLATLLLPFCGAAHAEEQVVGQKNKAFSVQKLKIKVGDSVGFRNDDAFFHNVFSLSPARNFDLGSFPKGQIRKVTFDKAGTIDVECAIHPEMQMQIEVTK
jgi:plastocyanin